MRSIVGLLLAAAVLFGGPAAARTDAAPPGRGPQETVEGPGDSADAAVRKALAGAQDAVVEQRHRQAALVLGGLVLALLVFAGSLRLDEATRGYYSGRLLAAAVALVALIGAAVWSWL